MKTNKNSRFITRIGITISSLILILAVSMMFFVACSGTNDVQSTVAPEKTAQPQLTPITLKTVSPTDEPAED